MEKPSGGIDDRMKPRYGIITMKMTHCYFVMIREIWLRVGDCSLES